LLKILKNKRITEIENEHFQDLVNNYRELHIDLGTGNGKFVYDLALKNPDKLFVGIEPTASNLYEYSKKANKNKLNNLIYIITSVENMGDELNGLADKIYVNFPWGSLLEAVVKDIPDLLGKIALLGKIGAEFNFTFAYSTIHEPVEIEKRNLPLLTDDYLKLNLSEIYKAAGLIIEKCTNLKPQDINKFGTLWAKKLYLGKSRDVYNIISRKS
jgi:16S rRNA (adenine(1408)-N(1))-methyltransferase